MSDTPRTDAFENLTERPINWWDFARELERENAELRAKIGELEKAFAPNFVAELHAECIKLERENAALKQRILDDNKAYGCELRDPSGTIWDHAKELQIENANLREDKERLDWLEKYGATPICSRAAIDTARKEAQP